MALVTELSARLIATNTKTEGGTTVNSPLNYKFSKSLANGTGNDQANAIVNEQYAISASGTQVIDLGTHTDDIGQSLSFTAVKLMYVCVATGGGAITIKPNSTEGFADWIGGTTPDIKIPAGGVFLLGNVEAGGWAVVDNSDDKLLLTETGGSLAATVDVMIIGVATIT